MGADYQFAYGERFADIVSGSVPDASYLESLFRECVGDDAGQVGLVFYEQQPYFTFVIVRQTYAEYGALSVRGFRDTDGASVSFYYEAAAIGVLSSCVMLWVRSRRISPSVFWRNTVRSR